MFSNKMTKYVKMMIVEMTAMLSTVRTGLLILS